MLSIFDIYFKTPIVHSMDPVPPRISPPAKRLVLLVDAEFRNTGLERSDKLAEDLQWFKEQVHAIPEPSTPGTSYARYLEELSEKDPPAFICHFYNVYFAHTAGGRMIGKKEVQDKDNAVSDNAGSSLCL